MICKMKLQAYLPLCFILMKLITSAIARIPPASMGSLAGCPHGCDCDSFVIICHSPDKTTWQQMCRDMQNFRSDVFNLRISGKPDVILHEMDCLPTLNTFDISNTSVSVLKPGFFKNANIVSLANFSRNEISSLDEGAFLGLHTLLELDISRNELIMLNPKVFQGLSSLRKLDLSFNKIQLLSPDTFNCLPLLESLKMGHNLVKVFLLSSFSNETSLQHLELQNNSLQTFGMFHMKNSTILSVLKHLDISFNPLECSCLLANMFSSFPNVIHSIVHSESTVCHAPLQLKGRHIIGLNQSDLICSLPEGLITYPMPRKSFLFRSSVTLECRAEGFPTPSVMWLTPWGHVFSQDDNVYSYEINFESSHEQHRKYKERNTIFVTDITMAENNDLVISDFRGSMAGTFTCFAVNVAGNSTLDIELYVTSKMKSVYIKSLFIGAYCSSGFLILGFLVGFVKMVFRKLLHKFNFKVPIFSRTPSVHPGAGDGVSHSFSFDITNNHGDDDKDDGEDDNNQDISSSNGLRIASDTECSDGQDPPASPGSYSPPGWRPGTILETFDEAKGRLRQGVGRKMEKVRKNVQSIKESGSVYVHNIVESGSSAASRMKAGVAMSVETVKFHVQSFKELCGTGDMGTQTTSMISVETDIDTSQKTEVVKQVTFV